MILFGLKFDENKKKQDILSKITNYGIQRDDLSFKINDLDAKIFASQGEKRTVVLSLKLGLIDYIYQKTKQIPIVLLDDCLSELDENRQRKLIEVLNNRCQTFITTTDVESIKKCIKEKYSIIDLKGVGIYE